MSLTGRRGLVTAGAGGWAGGGPSAARRPARLGPRARPDPGFRAPPGPGLGRHGDAHAPIRTGAATHCHGDWPQAAAAAAARAAAGARANLRCQRHWQCRATGRGESLPRRP